MVEAFYTHPAQKQAPPRAYIKLDQNSPEVFCCMEGFYVETVGDLTGVQQFAICDGVYGAYTSLLTC